MVLKNEFKYGIVEANNLDELYFFTIKKLLEKDGIGNYKNSRWYKIDSGSYQGGMRLEFDTYKGIVLNPTQRPLAPQARQGIPLVTDAKDIEDYFTNYIMDGGLSPNEHYRYSSWIVGMPDNIPLDEKGIPRGTRLNQVDWCINHFKKKGYGTNHCYITVGCAEGLQRYDWPSKSDTEKGSTECLRGFGLSIRDNHLDLECFFRSWDLVGGLPVNLGGLTMLMEYICSELEDVEPGALIANSSGLHMYGFSEDFAKMWVSL